MKSIRKEDLWRFIGTVFVVCDMSIQSECSQTLLAMSNPAILTDAQKNAKENKSCKSHFLSVMLLLEKSSDGSVRSV